jgi:transcriptional regulator with PAS, ATPase and Fis domain
MRASTSLPPPIHHYLDALLLTGRRPAFMRVDANGNIESWGGDIDRYLHHRLIKGQTATDHVDALVGMLPLTTDNACIQHLMTDAYRSVDLHLVADGNHTWVIFLDSTNEAHHQQTFQQQSNELQLLKAKQLSMLAQLRAQNAYLEAILNQLSVAAVRIAANGHVTFLNAYTQRLLDIAIIEDRIGKHWNELLQLGEGAAAAFQALLTTAHPEHSPRIRFQHITEGVERHLEVEVRVDPRETNCRIAYIYDVSDVEELRHHLQANATFEDMTGKSDVMLQTFQLIRDVARVNATVLIEGETGTGKELAARAIHACSPRKDGPFIVVNCAGFTDSLINSQLFGHKKGAFTDAVSNQIGVFEAANGGTILLDEIGDIPMNTQTRILRALEQREIIRIGETQARNVDIRILAATNKDLETEVKQGRFRLDLLYRIRVARVTLPPLRERREDIPFLARRFAATVAAENAIMTPVIGPDVMVALMAYPWPGNVRELRNAIEFAIIRCHDGIMNCKHLPAEIMQVNGNQNHPDAPTPTEREHLIATMRATEGRRDEAAHLLGISRATLYRRLKKHALSETDWR